ncbi:hypothetical protein PSN01_03097 [Micromonospora saelicesensis]|nr:hypothetical protein PSN01_03097 [Micromonospora saelicesensis]
MVEVVGVPGRLILGTAKPTTVPAVAIPASAPATAGTTSAGQGARARASDQVVSTTPTGMTPIQK